MKTTVTLNDFRNEFNRIRPDNFTYEGLEALFNYLESFEQDTGEEMELDVIAICCDYSEYANIEEIQNDYNNIESIEDLENKTIVIKFDSGIIIQRY